MDEDEAVARMRAADPAAGAEPDAERLAERTAERRVAVPDELAARRARRAPRWGAVAAVAAGALVVGGAGYGLGRATDDPAPQADTFRSELPAIAQRPMTESGSTAATDMAIAPGYGGRTTFMAPGLSDAPGTATAWAYDGAGTVSADTATRVAEVLGVDGEPRQEGGWVVGPLDGSGPSLQIGSDGAATLWYHDPELNSVVEELTPFPEGAAEPAIEVDPEQADEGVSGSNGGAADGGVVDEPATPDEQSDESVPDGPTAAPDEPAVIEPLPAPVEQAPEEPSAVPPAGQAPEGPAGVLYETLAALGLDPEAAEYAVQENWPGDQVTSVVAHQLVDGRRSGLGWHADVVDGEVYSLGGPLAPLTPLGEYDVVSPAEAVSRLTDPRFGGAQVWSDVEILPMEPVSPERDWNEPPGAPPAAGSPVPWPVTEVTITSAEPTLTDHGTSNGSTLLLPAYDLSDATGRTWRVLAVADHELAF